MNTFNDPFDDERLRDEEFLLDPLEKKRFLEFKFSPGEPTGTMMDYWHVRDLPFDEPISQTNPEVNKIMVTMLNRNEGRKGTPFYIEPIILKFKMHYLSGTDLKGRNLLHIACRFGLRMVSRFLIEKAADLSTLNLLQAQKDQLGMTPLYHLCMRGFDSKSDESPIRFLSRLRIVRLLVCGPDLDNIMEKE